MNLLRMPSEEPVAVNPDELQQTAELIEAKLAEFGIGVQVVSATSGPVITRYEIEPAQGVKGSQIVALSKDLARSMSLQAVRIVETIAGKNTMGIELPNEKRQDVMLSEILSSPVFTDAKSKLTVALGKDIAGTPVVGDLAKMPHLLVAGMTGSGKSVGVNGMIMSMLFKATPDEVRFIMIDPKMLELSIYDGIPHLLCPVVTDMREAGQALNWCVAEMEKRYRLLSHAGVRNLDGFNQKVEQAKAAGKPLLNPFSLNPDDPEPLEKLPLIVVVIDELADLMMTERKSVEQQIARLAQKARAAGIHMIVATQRPSVDVVTGLIKANIPTRMALPYKAKSTAAPFLTKWVRTNCSNTATHYSCNRAAQNRHACKVRLFPMMKCIKSSILSKNRLQPIMWKVCSAAKQPSKPPILSIRMQTADELFDQAVCLRIGEPQDFHFCPATPIAHRLQPCRQFDRCA